MKMIFLALFFFSNVAFADVTFETSQDFSLQTSFIGRPWAVFYARLNEPSIVFDEKNFREPFLPYLGGYCRFEISGPLNFMTIPKGTTFRMVGETFREKSRFHYKVLRRSIFDGPGPNVALRILVLCYADDVTQLTNDIVANTLSSLGKMTFAP